MPSGAAPASRAPPGSVMTPSRPVALLLIPLLAAGLLPAVEPARPPALERFTNAAPDFAVRLRIDQPELVFEDGEELTAAVSSARDGFIYLFREDAAGAVTCLFPNATERNNEIKASPPDGPPRWLTVPPAGAKTRFRLRAPGGPEMVKAVVCTPRLTVLERAVEGLTPTADPAKNVLNLDAALLTRVWAELTGTEGVRAAAGDPLGRQAQFANLARTQQWAEHTVCITVAGKGERGLARTVPLAAGVRAAYPPGGRPRRVGVFVGLSDYQSPLVPLLRVCDRDAADLAELMRAVCDLDDVVVLRDREATYARVEDVLARRLPAATRPGDEVVIYWSGHGGQMPEPGEAVRRPYRLYLVPYDGRPDDLASIRSTMILDTTFGQWVRALEGRKVLVLLDTCHSGAVADGAKAVALPGGVRAVPQIPEHFLADVFKGAKALGLPNVWLLASSRAEQPSFERREKDHGVMTFFLMERLSAKGRATVGDVAEYVKQKVPRYVAQKKLGPQDPVFDGPDSPVVVLRRQ